MSKYTREELRAKAQHCIQARENNDVRYLQLVLALSLRLGMAPADVMLAIEELAS